MSGESESAGDLRRRPVNRSGVSPTSHTYFSQRLKLHYLDWGNPDAPDLLLIHGVQDHCHNWDWTADALCDRYHVVVPDLRGHGDSEWSRGSSYQLLDYVYDINQLVEQESLDPVNIISHSMGGTIATLFAGVFPEKVSSLVSVEGVGGFWYKRNEDEHPQARVREYVSSMRDMAGRVPRKYPDLSDAFQRMQKSNPHLSEERARHLTIHGSNRNEDGTYTWKFDNYTHARSPFSMDYDQMTRLWDMIDCPTLLLNACQGYQHRTGQDGTLKHFRQGELIDIDDAGHWLHHDQFDSFLKHCEAFLGRHAR